MLNLFNDLYTFIYFLFFLALYVMYAKKKGSFKNFDATSYILIYYAITAFFSLLYYNISNGMFRDYSKITLTPYLYLCICFCIALFPIYKNDNSTIFRANLTVKSERFVNRLIVVLMICAILPFLESIIHLPNVLRSGAMADVYNMRLEGRGSDYLSFLGRKFFLILWLCNNLIPILLLYSVVKNKKKKYIVGLSLTLITIWIHSMFLGGRSKLVQNALYVIFVFFIFKQFIPENKRKIIIKYGVVVLSVAGVGLAAVSISRFASMEDTSSLSSIWEWIGLYAGEGALNFNALEWYVKGSTNGYTTFALPLSVYDGALITVEDLWNIKSKLGIPGNIFYTYMGPFVGDFGKTGGIVVLFILSMLVTFIYKSKHTNGMQKLCLICLWGKILMVGPIFYTYSTVDDQINLLISLIIVALL